MAKTGRPRKDEGEKGTTNVRIFDEMAEQIKDLLLVVPLSTAQIIQLVGGPGLKELHETYKQQIDKVKAARKAAEDAERQAKEETQEVSKNWHRWKVTVKKSDAPAAEPAAEPPKEPEKPARGKKGKAGS